MGRPGSQCGSGTEVPVLVTVQVLQPGTCFIDGWADQFDFAADIARIYHKQVRQVCDLPTFNQQRTIGRSYTRRL